jgi:hypothetical protein
MKKLETLQRVLRDLNVSIAKHKQYNFNNLLETLLVEKACVEQEIQSIIFIEKRSHERREETHLHE